MKEYILYGIREGETEQYMEDLLIATTKISDIEKVKTIATKDGFHSFRIAIFNGEKPDFTKVLSR